MSANDMPVEEEHFTRTSAYGDCAPTAGELAIRLQSPITTTYANMEKIAIERDTIYSNGMRLCACMHATNTPTGVFGMLLKWVGGGARVERVETVSGRECRVFSANSMQLISKTRTMSMVCAAQAHF